MLNLIFLSGLVLQGVPTGLATGGAPGDVRGGDPISSGLWRPIDGVIVQAGDKVVTRSQLEEFFDRRRSSLQINSQQDFERELGKALQAKVTLVLETQAGEDLGVDPNQVQRIINWEMQDQRRDHGTQGFASYLQENGIDPLQAADGRLDELYTYMWRSSITGQTNSIGQRPIHDRFVRPGELRSIYRVNRDELVDPDRVQFQAIDVPAGAVGGIEAAQELIAEIRQRALSGIPFGQLVREYGGGGEGITPMYDVPSISDPRVRAFAEKARVDDISEPIRIRDQGGTERMILLRLEAREEGPPMPPFDDRVVQRVLRTRFLRSWEERLLTGARQELRTRSYVWVSPQLVGPEEAEGTGGGRPGTLATRP